ncbi:MAG: FIST C-terminal domain-containing protein [Gammaproteobacteria bacterium]|nr:FIST C-terminal domain-containing protein [Gammaproteobacteria bacterium]
MSGFTSAHIQAETWSEACRQLVDRLGTDHPGRLAFLYISDPLAADTDRIIDCLRHDTGIPHWVGCVGMGLCGTGSETYDEAAISVLVTPFTDDDFRVLPDYPGDGDDWLAATQTWRQRSLASVAVIHGDPNNAGLPQQLVKLSEDLGNGYLIGGVASSETLPIQIADRVVSTGLSGVLFNGNVGIHTGLSQGCSLIGHKHHVTACQRNVIETIDERPALDVFKEAIGEVLARDLNRVGGYIFAALPIPGSDTGDYLVRNLIGIDPNRGLIAIGDLVEPGMEIQFARRDAQTAHDDLARMVEHVRARIPGSPRGALYHSCLGRGRNLFGDESNELRLVRDLLGDIPLAGFYANGEISHHRLYGYTGVLTLFS